MQGRLFDVGHKQSTPKGDLPGQIRLGFTNFVECESKGTMDATWLECILVICSRERINTPTMTELQGAWNLKLSASQAVDKIVSSRDRLSAKDRLCDAVQRVYAGESLRAASKATRIPITTIRRAMGRIKEKERCRICGTDMRNDESIECRYCADQYSYAGSKQ